MATRITIAGKKPKKGKRMNKNAHWVLTTTRARKRTFAATLLSTFNFGTTRIAIFSVRKHAGKFAD
jgi:hypothetical protein